MVGFAPNLARLVALQLADSVTEKAVQPLIGIQRSCFKITNSSLTDLPTIYL